MVGAGALSRRRLIVAAAGGATGALGMLLAGCGSSTSAHSEAANLYGEAREERLADALMLDAALSLELRLAALYRSIAPRLSGAAARLVRAVAAQEAQHADAVRHAILGLGGRPTPPEGAPAFASPRSAREALMRAHSEEERAIAFYIDALPKLSADDRLRAPMAAIVANEAEHLALLARALGEPPAPSSIVRGQA